jgi:hypothetical protein
LLPNENKLAVIDFLNARLPKPEIEFDKIVGGPTDFNLPIWDFFTPSGHK